MSKFVCLVRDIKPAIMTASSFTGSILPILGNLVFANGTVKAGDGASQITLPTPIKAEFSAPAEKLRKIVSTFSDDTELTFNVGAKLTVTANKSRQMLSILPVADFPLAKLDGEPQRVKLKQEDIAYHMGNVVHAMPNSHVKVWMNSMLFKKAEYLTIGATMGTVIASSQQVVECDDFEFAIAAGAVSRLQKMMKTGNVSLEIYWNKVRFIADDFDLIVPRIPEKYVDLEKGIPKKTSPIKFTKTDFINAASAAGINVSKFQAAGVKVNGDMTITCKNFDEESSDSLPVFTDVTGEWGFNLEQMREAVASIQSEQVEMHIVGGTNALFVSEDGMQRNVIAGMRA